MYSVYKAMSTRSLALVIWTMMLLLVPATCCPLLSKPTMLGFGHGIIMGGLHIMIAKKVPVKVGEGQLVLRGDDSSCDGSPDSPALSNSKKLK